MAVKDRNLTGLGTFYNSSKNKMIKNYTFSS